MSVLPCFLNVHWQICFVGTNVQITALKKEIKRQIKKQCNRL